MADLSWSMYPRLNQQLITLSGWRRGGVRLLPLLLPQPAVTTGRGAWTWCKGKSPLEYSQRAQGLALASAQKRPAPALEVGAPGEATAAQADKLHLQAPQCVVHGPAAWACPELMGDAEPTGHLHS